MNFSVLNILCRLSPELGTSGSGRKRPVTLGVVLLIVSIFVFSIFPIIWYGYVPLADYPNHLARLQIHKTLSSNPNLSRFYEFHWTLIPYLGFDLLSLPLMYYLPVELAGKIVLVLSLLMIYGGTVLLDRQLNRENWGISLFGGIFLYNGAFKYGFISYIIGVGFAILTFWIWIRYREKANGLWIIAFILTGGVVCTMHLYAFGIYAVCVASHECAVVCERVRLERISASQLRIPFSAAVSLTLPLLVFWFGAASRAPGELPWGHAGPNSWGHPGPSLWGGHESSFWMSLAWKFEGFASPIFYSDPAFEIPLLLMIFVLLVWALVTRTIVLNSRMVITLGAFAALFIVMPHMILGTNYFDYRLPSAVAFIALASFGWGTAWSARINLLRLLLAICLIVRVGSVFLEWYPAQGMIAEYETALRLVPPGSRLLVIVGHTAWGDRDPPLRHVPVLAAAEQGVFVPSIFTDANATANGLKLKPDYLDYWKYNQTNDFKRFDYLMEVRQPPVKIPPGITLEEIGRGRTFVLYRIEQQRLPNTD
jgi:hypothetical protein